MDDYIEVISTPVKRKKIRRSKQALRAEIEDAVQAHAKRSRRQKHKSQLVTNGRIRCRWCGQALHPRDVTMDHVLPVRDGGRASKKNLVPACESCNQLRGALREVLGRELFMLVTDPIALAEQLRELVRRRQE